MITKHFLCLFVILFGTFALACPPNTRVCVPVQHNQVVVSAVVHHHQQVVSIIPSVVLVPTYTASYSACDDNLRIELQGLKAEIKALREAIAAANIIPPPLPPGTTPTSPTPTLQEFQYNEKLLVSGLTKCSNCHQPNNANQKGGGFILFDENGQNKDFGKDSSIVNAKITKLVQDNSMPKGLTKLTKEEKEQILDFYKPEESTPQK